MSLAANVDCVLVVSGAAAAPAAGWGHVCGWRACASGCFSLTCALSVAADLRAQRGCWHPVAFAAGVAGQPVHADLLGEPLVLWPGRDGSVRVMSDLCVHRGTALSLGTVSGDEIVCAYHGWRYRADGRCAAIPQLADAANLSAR
jgi:nitrite reductase/ring-hydroxylating ferredoxin subunit